MIASDVQKIVADAVAKVAPGIAADVKLDPPKNASFGDFATSVALQIVKSTSFKSPRDLAGAIAKAISDDPASSKAISKVEVAGPGFLNLTLSDAFWADRLREILEQGERFGRSDAGKGTKVLLEYVSANPTGPLHVGHARGAAVADTVANLLDAAGYAVSREFYINDVGVQMNNLGRSVWYRYAEALGRLTFPEPVKIPEDDSKLTPAEKRKIERFGGLYHGEYIKEIAALVKSRDGDKWMQGVIMEDGVPEPAAEAVAALREVAYPILLEEQKQTLARYGVRFDRYYQERTIHAEKLVEQALDDLKQRGFLYEKDGATWFRSTAFGDDKDRVVVKSDGSTTYFAPDIAYHREKLKRGYQILINAWGADHHGYIPRMRAAMQALGLDAKKFHVIVIQLVRLLSGGQEVKMSKRAGSYVTLQDLIEQVGPDAGRYLMLVRSPDSHLDFDLDLAKKQSNDNPVFYVQYGHARVCSVFAKARDAAQGVDWRSADLTILTKPMERDLVRKLVRFPEEVAAAGEQREPHRLTTYLQDLVRSFHAYYSKKDETGAPEHRIVNAGDEKLTAARLALAAALRTVLGNGLRLCGVSAPERMEAAEPADA